MTRLATLDMTRNLRIMAHIDPGKTTTTERILYDAGVIDRLGEVHEGSTVTDWMPEEQARGISITAASTTFNWGGCRCNLVDTPGHVDLSLIHISEPTRLLSISYAVFCLKK